MTMLLDVRKSEEPDKQHMQQFPYITQHGTCQVDPDSPGRAVILGSYI